MAPGRFTMSETKYQILLHYALGTSPIDSLAMDILDLGEGKETQKYKKKLEGILKDLENIIKDY